MACRFSIGQTYVFRQLFMLFRVNTASPLAKLAVAKFPSFSYFCNTQNWTLHWWSAGCSACTKIYVKGVQLIFMKCCPCFCLAYFHVSWNFSSCCVFLDKTKNVFLILYIFTWLGAYFHDLHNISISCQFLWLCALEWEYMELKDRHKKSSDVMQQ